MKQFEKWLLIVVILSLVIPLTSAMTWDNVLDYETNTKIRIKDNLGLGGILVEVEKIHNTDYCFSECSTTWKVIIYQDEDNFLDVVDFKDKNGYGKNLEYEFEYLNKDKWETFNPKRKLKPGTYTIRLTGYKDFGESIDWIPTFYGKKVSEWAWWHTPSPHMYFKFNEVTNGSVPVDTAGNITAVVTGDINYTTGKLNNAVSFDKNVGARIDTQWNGNLSDGINYTLAFWIRDFNPKLSLQRNQHIIGNGEAGAGDYGEWQLFLNGSKGLEFNIRDGDSVGTQLAIKTSFVANTSWQRVVISRDGGSDTGSLNIYANNNLLRSYDLAKTFNVNVTDSLVYIGKNPASIYPMNMSLLDDLVFYYDDWSAADVETDWNNGAGLAADTVGIALTVNLHRPANANETSNADINFSGISTVTALNFTNTSVYVWYSNSTPFNITTSMLDGLQNTTNISITGFSSGNFNWNIFSCGENASAILCNFASSNRSLVIGASVDAESYNLTAFELVNQSFQLNITVPTGESLTTSYFIYNYTNYTVEPSLISGLAYSLTSSIITPSVGMEFRNDTNVPFYWNIRYGTGARTNTTVRYQNSSFVALTLCNATYDTTFVNITFKDETDSSRINATIDSSTFYYYLSDINSNKTLTYSTAVNNTEYPFCFTPSTKIANTIIERIQYALPGYPQRRFSAIDTALTSTPTNQILYLLASTDGTYSTYQVQTSSGSPLADVAITVERQIGGSWTLIESGNTDSAGAVTFWLNPDYDYRITATKTGYPSVQVTVRPSQSTYTIVMEVSSQAAEYSSNLEGLKWYIYPAPGRLDTNTTYLFQFNISAALENIETCKFEIANTTTILDTTSGCNANGGNLSISFNTSNHLLLRGRYYVDIGDGFITLDTDAQWRILNVTEYGGTIKNFLEGLKDWNEFGEEGGRAEFSRIVWFFLLVALAIGTITFSTGWDFSTQGGALLVLMPLVLAASVAGFFTLDIGPNSFFNQYTIAIITGFITLGWAFNHIGRTT